MERKIISQLKTWKESPLRKPLILAGARQVGKTFPYMVWGNVFKKITFVILMLGLFLSISHTDVKVVPKM